LGALCLLAQAEANAGRLDAAEASCQRILKLAPFTALPYHLRARIAEERGDSENAKLLLKKVMYLNPASVWAALELGAIYRREGDRARATQMHRVALELISDLNDEASVPTEEYAVEAPLLVGDLKRQLQGEAHFSG
jgi:chemotaxis protein methyltransferase CheR